MVKRVNQVLDERTNCGLVQENDMNADADADAYWVFKGTQDGIPDLNKLK